MQVRGIAAPPRLRGEDRSVHKPTLDLVDGTVPGAVCIQLVNGNCMAKHGHQCVLCRPMGQRVINCCCCCLKVSGTPIDKEVLLRNFWWCWDRLRAEGILFDHADFPSFFSFMTLLAIRIFLEQKVEIAILEVGSLGSFALFDCCAPC